MQLTHSTNEHVYTPVCVDGYTRVGGSYTCVGVTGIQGKWEQEQEQKMGAGTCKNCCYSSNFYQ